MRSWLTGEAEVEATMQVTWTANVTAFTTLINGDPPRYTEADVDGQPWYLDGKYIRCDDTVSIHEYHANE